MTLSGVVIAQARKARLVTLAGTFGESGANGAGGFARRVDGSIGNGRVQYGCPVTEGVEDKRPSFVV